MEQRTVSMENLHRFRAGNKKHFVGFEGLLKNDIQKKIRAVEKRL